MFRSLRILVSAVVLITLGLEGCVVVPRYARGTLANPAMEPGGDALTNRSLRKLHSSREGAAGGDGLPAGGGCGCGQ